jgi:hypothetical protein
MPSVPIYLTSWGGATRPQFEVSIEAADITAQPTMTGCLLRVPVRPQPDGTSGGRGIIALEGWMRMAGDEPANVGVQVPLQTLHPNYDYLRVPLSPIELEYIESRRSRDPDGAVTFELNLAAIVLDDFQPPHGHQGPGQSFVPRTARDNGNASNLRIGRELWLKLLDQAGFRAHRIVELPEMSGPSASEWATCIKVLDRAILEFRGGQYESSMASCRLIAEGLVTVVAARWGLPKPADGMPQWLKALGGRIAHSWPEDEEAGEVLASLLRAVWSWTSTKHHYGSKVPIRREAEAAIALTTDLLMMAGHFLEAHPEPAAPPKADPKPQA